MTRLRQLKTSFTSGEIAPELLGRGDLRAYDNGAATLQNVLIHPTGGVTRRPGFYFVDGVPSKARLIPFEFNTEQTYLMVLLDYQMMIFRDGVKRATITTPWSEAQITRLTWTQSADTLLICHRDVPPQTVSRTSDTAWHIDPWTYVTDDKTDKTYQPFYKYAPATMTLTPSGTEGAVTVTASGDIFKPQHVGTHMRIGGKEVRVSEYASPTVIVCETIETLASSDPTVDWSEQSFSDIRGWPTCCAFHQDRLVIGGSRDLPNRLWFSKSGDLFNFNLGEGLDDEAIEFAILSDQINAVHALFSGRHLQVFTSGAEWMVTGSPLTPTTVQLNRQTRIGSYLKRYIPPVNVDGATLFVGRTGQELREFLYADVEQAYQANDLALLSTHLYRDPIDQAFDPKRRILFTPLSDGRMAALTLYRTEKVSAWSVIETQGAFESVTVVGDEVYVLVRRENNARRIERLDENSLLDAALVGETYTPVKNWSGLEHINGYDVMIVADGIVQPNQTVKNNQITLKKPASHVQVGLAYTHKITPMPPNANSVNGAGRAARMINGVFRLHQTQDFKIDTGRGIKDIPLTALGHGTKFDQKEKAITRDVTLRSYGWHKDGTKSLWQIESQMPLSFTLLSVTMEIKVND